MEEIKFEVTKQEDGWYLASTKSNLKSGRIITEAPDYKTLKDKIREATEFFLRDKNHKELNLPENPNIRLIYTNLLFENPEAERIVIAGGKNERGYKASFTGAFNLDLHHKDLDKLKNLVAEKVREYKHHNKHVEFRLEEILR